MLTGKTNNQPLFAQYCFIDCELMVLRCAGTGQPNPLYFNANKGTIEEIATIGGPIGLSPSIHYNLTQINLHTNDRIILYSNGLVELLNTYCQQYDVDKLKKAIMQNIQVPYDVFSQYLLNTLTQQLLVDNEIDDDVTIITIEII